jgi:hypothetical protein
MDSSWLMQVKKKSWKGCCSGAQTFWGRRTMHVSPSMPGIGNAAAIRQQLKRGDSRVGCWTCVTSLELSRL